ncbi:MAG: AAA family ATPase [Myxococcales bacterium]|nr:AAA family ATPase [Myxococcales bacterium]
MTTTLTRIELAGYRSIASLDLRLGRTTVLIGANGSGKSNLLSFLQLVPQMRTQSLRLFVGRAGGANALLHRGVRKTPELRFRIEATAGDGHDTAYAGSLGGAGGDSLIFVDERVEARNPGELLFVGKSLGAGHAESQLEPSAKNAAFFPAKEVRAWVMRMNFFHFHDTSQNSPLRSHGRQEEDRYLKSDGSNLAPYLYALSRGESASYRSAWARITGLVRRVAPFIAQLEPTLVAPDAPERSVVRLDWVDELGDRYGVHQLSDGTLRAIALITALAQPVENLPSFIAIDEPELGLHPSALALICGLVKSVSAHAQIVVATQSPALLDEFEPMDVVVVERRDGATTMERLDLDKLSAWLEEYSLSEIWDKNVFGGRP